MSYFLDLTDRLRVEQRVRPRIQIEHFLWFPHARVSRTGPAYSLQRARGGYMEVGEVLIEGLAEQMPVWVLSCTTW